MILYFQLIPALLQLRVRILLTPLSPLPGCFSFDLCPMSFSVHFSQFCVVDFFIVFINSFLSHFFLYLSVFLAPVLHNKKGPTQKMFWAVFRSPVFLFFSMFSFFHFLECFLVFSTSKMFFVLSPSLFFFVFAMFVVFIDKISFDFF